MLGAELCRHRELHRRQLAEYRAIEERDFASMSDDRARLQHLVLQAGIGLETFWLDWLDRALAQLADGEFDEELDADLGET
ncbi:hypothetical protein ACFC1R_10585 [Kitasatospora sp. NPDC056138]|uniref:hypothetical protein n=1 Tax=Kitasatospora sp. NPDC056138 TaxID=3345724 RepID=UPI0035E13A9F